MLTVEPHPLLDPRCFITTFPAPLGELPPDRRITALFALDAPAPVQSSDAIRKAVRDLLRHGGFKPTGRSKPASEYLIGAATQGRLAAINLAVDVCNAVSLHSGLPISVIDLDRTTSPLVIAIARPGTSYVFNAAGQVIDVGGLLCLCDADGPCANAVKDAQRTKTSPDTTRTLTVLWGTTALPGHAEAAERWYHQLLNDCNAEITRVSPAADTKR